MDVANGEQAPLFFCLNIYHCFFILPAFVPLGRVWKTCFVTFNRCILDVMSAFGPVLYLGGVLRSLMACQMQKVEE